MDYGGKGEDATVRAMFAAFASRDLDAVLAVAHPDIELWAQPTAELVGRTEPYRGHAGVVEYLADVERAWAAFAVEPTDVRAAAGGVICFGRAEGRAHGEDHVRRLPVIWVFRLREDLIVFCRVARTAEEATELVSAA